MKKTYMVATCGVAIIMMVGVMTVADTANAQDTPESVMTTSSQRDELRPLPRRPVRPDYRRPQRRPAGSRPAVTATQRRRLHKAKSTLERHADANKDGYITLAEFQAYKQRMVANPAIYPNYRQFDTNGDGQVDRQEIDAMKAALERREQKYK